MDRIKNTSATFTRLAAATTAPTSTTAARTSGSPPQLPPAPHPAACLAPGPGPSRRRSVSRRTVLRPAARFAPAAPDELAGGAAAGADQAAGGGDSQVAARVGEQRDPQPEASHQQAAQRRCEHHAEGPGGLIERHRLRQVIGRDHGRQQGGQGTAGSRPALRPAPPPAQ